jgi:hypothetical protein
MRNLLLSTALLSILTIGSMAHAHAEEAKPDDRVAFDITAEDWVTTKTARVAVNVEAAVSSANAGSMRADMIKSVNGLASGEWRLTGFNRSQDQTGLERWSASFEARLPEASLGGLGDNAKKLSKAGLQLSVGDIDFSPTLDEIEAVRSSLRASLYKKAVEQLATLNSTIAGRNFRISGIDFNSNEMSPMPMRTAKAQPMMAMASAADSGYTAERSEKIKQVAHVMLAALPAATEVKH